MYCYVSYVTRVELYYLHYHKVLYKRIEMTDKLQLLKVTYHVCQIGQVRVLGIGILQLFPLICFNNDVLVNHM